MSETIQLLSTKEAARLLGLSPKTLEAQRCRGQRDKSLPVVPWVKLSSRCIKYRREDLVSYLASLSASTSPRTAA